MNIGLFLLIPALSGYWFLTHCHRTNHQIARNTGYHVLFQSSVAGGVIFSVAHLIILIIHRCIPQFSELWKSWIPYPFADTVALGILVSFVLPYICNFVCTAHESDKKTADESGNLIELLLRESIEQGKFIEITLKSRKSYIGSVINSGAISHRESDISLIPVASGYRNKDSQELEITTNYAPVIAESYPDAKSYLDYKDFQIIIPKSEIVSARIFDPDIYRKFQKRARRRRPRR